jgi:AAA+ superfamily predicted ATPase
VDTLCLLKPKIKKDFLNGGRGDGVEYLKIPENLTLDMLESDIKAGAKQFEGVKDFFEKAGNNESRYKFVRAKSKEDGLLAVTYLAGIKKTIDEENRAECEDLIREERAFENGSESWHDYDYDYPDEDDYDYGEKVSDDIDWLEYDEPELPPAFDEESNKSDYRTYNDDLGKRGEKLTFGEDEYEPGEMDSWIESSNRIPLVDIKDIKKYRRGGDELIQFPFGNMVGGGFIQAMGDPYWKDCREGAICILIPSDYALRSEDVELLDCFMGNSQVYVVSCGETGDETNDSRDDDLDFGNYFTVFDEFENELLLEYGSDSVSVKLRKEDAFSYYSVLLKSWLARYNLIPEKDFPMDRVVTQLMRLRRKDKSYVMYRLLGLLCEKENIRGELKTEHLTRFSLFRYIFRNAGTGNGEAFKRLENDLVGLDTVKEQVRDIVDTMKLNNLRERLGMSEGGPHNVAILLGPPGVAKTTVAKKLGEIMTEENLLPGNRFICINGAELKGKFVGHSAPQTKKLFEDYDVIMIDEAYSLTSSGASGTDTFAQEAMAQLMTELEKHSRDKLVMFAGYGGEGVSRENNKMLEFINANPGLASRISYTIEFPTYTAQDMVEIVHKQAELMKFKLDRSADEELLEYFSERVKDKSFGNGREARNLIETCQCYMARRIFAEPEEKRDKKAVETLMKSDVLQALDRIKKAHKSQNGVSQRFGFL